MFEEKAGSSSSLILRFIITNKTAGKVDDHRWAFPSASSQSFDQDIIEICDSIVHFISQQNKTLGSAIVLREFLESAVQRYDEDYDITLEEETLLSSLVTDLPPMPSLPVQELPVATSSKGGAKIAPKDHYHVSPRFPASNHLANKVVSSVVQGKGTGFPAQSPVQPKTISAIVPHGDGVVSYPDLSKALPKAETSESAKEDQLVASRSTDDTRSPLVRFRTFPKKPFSVSDLTAGSWCELQYWYTLTRLPYGRKTRTRAMKEGTRVHKDLEDEVHTTVRIEIASKTDAFGLRLWNIVQGLRTLRDTGLTRELEVWGFVDGNVVNGIIDGLSSIHPDPEFERELRRSRELQPNMADYFPPRKTGNEEIPQVYLTDVKTRGKRTTANAASLRPAKVQLFLYHRFLSDMAADKLDYLRVFRRYNLDPDEPFSDSFLAQMANLHDEEFFDASETETDVDTDGSFAAAPPLSGASDSSQSTPTQQQQPSSSDRFNSQPSWSPRPPDLVKYRTLRELVPLLVSELRQTFPHGPDSVGRLLSVEYRYQLDGSLIDTRIFPMDDRALDVYLEHTMAWWQGKRDPRGVQIEDAWKCFVCEFAESCVWRREMDEDRLQSARRRLEVKRESGNS
ncbi:hypothetical protein SODALDRAFT_354280 [Sodiomyces alkalinus F11]|uniref:Exonuclease V n=1 Tax=Sodiomyces alkalinus (strain CBS 110278 / VKM F-3762 / F11) TaxID=1314773 RepID=A0A3N2Q5X1_SODAK|nr:hypothetical protein SODALDRAFT_354280 [Sodiomyces alkalinus F11]ROT42152.1 hypothetical protein SODALDRAFT_354280 [Sodiomyces alkalinus F11]